MNTVKFDKEKNEYKIKVSIINKVFSLIPIVMFCVGLYIFFSMLFNYKDLKMADFVGLIFVGAWTIGVFFMGKSAIKMLTANLILNQDGITVKSILGRDFIAWSQVEDYGLSFYGRTRGGKTYHLYFSKAYLQAENNKTKILKGKMIKYVISEYNYEQIKTIIIPFCKTFCPIEPFVCED